MDYSSFRRGKGETALNKRLAVNMTGVEGHVFVLIEANCTSAVQNRLMNFAAWS